MLKESKSDSSDASVQQNRNKKWSKEERDLFVQLHKQFKNNFKMYAPYFKTREESQIKSFYYNVTYLNRKIRAGESYSSQSQQDLASAAQSTAIAPYVVEQSPIITPLAAQRLEENADFFDFYINSDED
ncbi:SANT/Myb_domain [Hexamita inflata]|uniref:SANT/Myb domain n=1 Tax=Hexamita inflata TaxID=28002 RepID=A0AA86NGF3_9EUKA|nr:SANT/Myb domain [Hexamita inflata]